MKTPAHLAARVAALRERMAKFKADALLVTNPKDIRYLTGFCGDDSWAVVTLKPGRDIVISDFRFDEEIAHAAPHVVKVIRKGAITDALKKTMKRRKLRRIALQSDHVSLAERKAVAKKIGGRKLVDVEDKLIEQRSVKGPDEVDAIRRALAIHQRAYRETLRWIKPGQTEKQVAAYLEYRMACGGSDGTSFPTIVAADANASLPHAVPGPRKIQAGGTVLIDSGARWGGYCSDLTRVVALGKMPAKIREIYKIVLDAQLAAIAAIAPGKKLKDIDKVARDIIKKAGYGDRFGHGLGHGIGLDIHEQPVLSYRMKKGELKPGHVVTVEPGIYLPGVGGVRIEDDVLVTMGGHEVLSDLPKDLESAIIE